MKPLYREINTLRILPLDFLKNYDILLKWDTWDDEKLGVLTDYYNWAMGRELSFSDSQNVYKAFCLIGDSMNIQDFNSRLEVYNRNNAKS